MKQVERKRLYIDIETAPNVGWFWRCGYNLSLNYQNILKERAIICIAYKWAHEKKTHILSWNMDHMNPLDAFDDKKLLQQIIPIMDQADEIVAHNLDRFDLPWIRTQAIKHDIPMRHDYPAVDTLKWARNWFNFNSNKLDDLASFFGIKCRKIKTTAQLWIDVFWHGLVPMLRKMEKYCMQDVRVLEAVHNRMLPYVPADTSLSASLRQCPECGAMRMTKQKTRWTKAGLPRVLLKCAKCSKHRTVPGIKLASQERKDKA